MKSRMTPRFLTFAEGDIKVLLTNRVKLWEVIQVGLVEVVKTVGGGDGEVERYSWVSSV